MSKTNFSKVDRLVDKAMRDGLTLLGNDVNRRAKVLAPFDPERTESGPHLRATGKVDVNFSGDRVEISYNKPYAKRRHYENKKNPDTKLYLTQALKSITNLKPYFRKSF